MLGISPASRERANEWVEIDLDAIHRIDRVDLYPRNDAGHAGEGFPVDFRIQASEDQVVWADVLVEKNYARPGGEAQIFGFNPINARYVRVVGTALAAVGADSVMQLARVEVRNVPLVTELASEIIITGDGSFKLYVNGAQAASGGAWTEARKADVTLAPGDNIIAAEVSSNGGHGGLLAQITVDGKLVAITNSMWKTSIGAPAGWNGAGFDDAGWAYAVDCGPYKKYPYNAGNPEIIPDDSMARWILGECAREADDDAQTRYFRFTINIDPATGAVTIPQPPAGKTPADRTATPMRETPALWKLAAGGKPEVAIIRGIDEDISILLAATELQAYLGEMIGEKPEISQTLDNSKVNILIGVPGNAAIDGVLEALGISVQEENLGYDGYLLKTAICKGAKVALLTGNKPRSVLYAAYRFLETLGCRFYGPKTKASDNEIVPLLPDLAVSALDERHKPETKLRMLVNGSYRASNTDILESMADWGAKNGFNSILLTLRPSDLVSGTPYKDTYPDEPWEHYDCSPLTKRGFEIMYAAHNWVEFVPPGVRAAGTWYTDEENVRLFLDNAVAFTKGHPEAAAIGIWQPDGPRSSISKPGPVGHQNETWRFTDWNLYLMNRIAAEFKRENIKNATGGDMRVMWMAYVEGCRPPLYNVPDDLIDLYYYHAWQNYRVPLNSDASDKQADWILDDWYRRPQNSDHAPEPVPDALLAQRPVVATWSNYLASIGFKGDAVLVDHLNIGIGRELRFPAISYTNLGPVRDLEGDHRYMVAMGLNGYTNCYGHSDYSNYLFPIDPDPYLHRRMAEALWKTGGDRDARDSDFFISFYGEKYATRTMRFFDQIYFELLADKRDYYSVKRAMGELYGVIASLKDDMLGDPGVTGSQKMRIERVFNWYNRRVIPYKLQYYNKGDLRDRIVGLLY